MKSALQEFIEWGDEMMLKYPMKELGFGQAIDKAEELLKTKVWWVVRLAMFEISVHPDDVMKIMQWKKDGIDPEGKYVSYKRVIEKVENTGGRPLVRTYARLIEDEI